MATLAIEVAAAKSSESRLANDFIGQVDVAHGLVAAEERVKRRQLKTGELVERTRAPRRFDPAPGRKGS